MEFSKEKILVGEPDIVGAELNEEQRAAVCHDQGPLMIIAGAGTGKTRVITYRIAYLIASKKARPEEILALTFTEMAAAEMEERVDVLLSYGVTNVWISTFHSFGDRILREHALELGLSPDFRVLTRPEQIIFFREHLFEFPLSYYRPLGNPTRYLDAIITLISRAKDEDVSPEEYLAFAQELEQRAKQNPSDRELAERAAQQMELALTYQKYQQLLAQSGKVDFGDQVTLTLRLFREHPIVVANLRARFKYILVDEFQDTNYAQFQLVRLLAGEQGNITVVADDDQSIYKFRGAAISNILNFKQVYPTAKQVVLTQNYRSTQVILDAAYCLIGHNNPDRLEVKNNINKRLKALVLEGNPVQHLHYDTLSSESDAVAKLIEEKVRTGGFSYRDFAILVRSNADADPFMRSLNMRGISYQFSGSRGLYQREEVRLLISFLRTLTNFQDTISLYHLASSEIYQFPMADLITCMNLAHRTNRSLHYILSHWEQYPELEELSAESKATAQKLMVDNQKYLELSRHKPVGVVLYQFLTESGYLKRLTQESSLEADVKIQNIARFFDVVQNYSEIGVDDTAWSFVSHLDLLIEAGDDPATAQADSDVDAVNILTIHKAKGLEFPVVFMVSLVDHKFPVRRRGEPIELPEELVKDILPSGDFHLQEERRLFYVGMTRAQKELYLTSARDYGGVRARKVSQFVLEALDMPRADEACLKASALEAIQQHAPPPTVPINSTGVIPENQVLNLSYFQIDDYLTCPLKYKFVHILRVPILPHHTVIYGRALHEAIREYNLRKFESKEITLDDLLRVFDQNWISEGFLTREHEEHRFQAGHEALKRFYEDQERAGLKPTLVEQEFSFSMGNNRILGRWDRIDIRNGEVYIIDFKSSDIRDQKNADRRARESLQLFIYALAYKEIHNQIPSRVELHFVETGLVGRAEVTEKALQKTMEQIHEAAKGIRARDYIARPSYMACQYCAYAGICPATRSDWE